jgi:CheY-like chemotaxis protein
MVVVAFIKESCTQLSFSIKAFRIVVLHSPPLDSTSQGSYAGAGSAYLWQILQLCGVAPLQPLRGEAIDDARKPSLQIARVLLVEDFDDFRLFIASLLTVERNLRVIGEATSGLEAVERAQELTPDVILLDIGLPGLNGIEAAQRILQVMPESKIIFLTQETSREIMLEALDLGARGYVAKARAGTDLLPALDAVLQGSRFVSAT